MRIRRTFLIALIAFALATPPNLPVQAEAMWGYEITYLSWDWQTSAYVAVGQRYSYCDMPGEESWGQTEFGLGDCGVRKEELVFFCRGSSYTYDSWWWTGSGWSHEEVCVA